MAPTSVQHRATPRWVLSGVALATAGLVLVLALTTGRQLKSNQPSDAPEVAPPAASAEAPETPAIEVAEGFLYAFGTVQAEKAISYLAEDADIAALMTFIGAEDVKGTLHEFRMLFTLLSAQGYRHKLGDCEQVTGAVSDVGTTVRCPFTFHGLRSGEMGLGPFGGSSHFLVVVNDGLIVDASWSWDLTEFVPQLWQPFANWLRAEHPKDVARMYNPDGGATLTRESALLWDVRTREFSRAVADAGTITGTLPG